MSIELLLGKTLAHVVQVGNEAIFFTELGGEQWKMYHSQDCCESVTIDDICGDLQDLVGREIVLADEASMDGESEDSKWTFYRLATAKGYVTIKWYGSSNGYYSTSVDFDRVEAK